MLQTDRNWLYQAAYSLDNLRRIKGNKGQLFVVFTHEELEKLASNMRDLAAKDEARLVEGNHGKSHSH